MTRTDQPEPRGTSATLASLLDMTNAYLAQRLEGLTDEEWLWEPAPGCWSIRGGKMDFVMPVPSPEPFTTIAWRLHHVQACNETESHWMRDRDYDWSEVKVPRNANEAVEMWRLSADALREAVAELSDVALEGVTKRGLPRVFFASTLVRENIHHGAEIGVLRDLYRAQ
jgi:DinB family protein